VYQCGCQRKATTERQREAVYALVQSVENLMKESSRATEVMPGYVLLRLSTVDRVGLRMLGALQLTGESGDDNGK